MLVTASNGVEIVSNQAATDKESFCPRLFLAPLLFDLDRAFVGLPVTGDAIQDLVGAFTAGAESIGGGHGLVLKCQGLHF
jgi:hypothetical protein